MSNATETARKWLHLAPGVLAFAVRDLGQGGTVLVTLALLVFNLWFFPRLGGSRLWRQHEQEQGEAPGMIFYPLALLLVALAAGGRLEIVAAAWGMLAFGDAAATLAGQRWGQRPLPWTPGKSWLGFGAFLAVSWLAMAVLVAWTVPHRYSLWSLLAATGAAALAGAIIESLPWAMDDNFSVTLLGSGALLVALEVAESPRAVLSSLPAGSAGWGLAVVVALGALAFFSGALNRGGSLAGLAVGGCVWLGTGWRGVLVLLVFVTLGTVTSRWRRRAEAGSRHEPPRRAENVLANGTVAAACGLLAATQLDSWAVVAMVGALAAATADTVGGELGIAAGGRTWLLTNARPVTAGADGGVSAVGTLCTVLGAAAIAALAVALGLLTPRAAGWVAVAGTAGALLDSLLGATLERRGLLDNEGVNLLSTLAAAWLAAQLHWIGG